MPSPTILADGKNIVGARAGGGGESLHRSTVSGICRVDAGADDGTDVCCSRISEEED